MGWEGYEDAWEDEHYEIASAKNYLQKYCDNKNLVLKCLDKLTFYRKKFDTSKIIENFEYDVDVLFKLAQYYEKIYDYNNAYEILKKCIKLTKSNYDICYNFALIAMKIEKYDEASEMFKYICEKFEHNSDIFYHYGVSLKKENKISEAISMFKRVLLHDEFNINAIKELSEISPEKEKYKKIYEKLDIVRVDEMDFTDNVKDWIYSNVDDYYEFLRTTGINLWFRISRETISSDIKFVVKNCKCRIYVEKSKNNYEKIETESSNGVICYNFKPVLIEDGRSCRHSKAYAVLFVEIQQEDMNLKDYFLIRIDDVLCYECKNIKIRYSFENADILMRISMVNDKVQTDYKDCIYDIEKALKLKVDLNSLFDFLCLYLGKAIILKKIND